MKFNTIIKNIISPSEKPLSRIYGYQRVTDGTYQVVSEEAKVIASVINVIANRSSDSIDDLLEDLIQKLSTAGTRNRSGKRWTRSALIGLVRPIYAGIAVSPRGVWRKSKIYPAIVSVDTIKTAMKRLKTDNLL